MDDICGSPLQSCAAWGDVICGYARCDLTYEMVLVAMGGIAARIQTLFNLFLTVVWRQRPDSNLL